MSPRSGGDNIRKRLIYENPRIFAGTLRKSQVREFTVKGKIYRIKEVNAG